MSSQVILILEGGRLGPFENEDAAREYLTLLQATGEVVPLVSPPPMSDLLLGALAHIRENGTLEDFLQKYVETGYSDGEIRAAFDNAFDLNKTALFNEGVLTDEELATLIWRRNPHNRIQAIKELRRKRPMGLLEAKDLIHAVSGK
jgi:hypothetical protein